MKFNIKGLFLSALTSVAVVSGIFYTSCRPSGNDGACAAIACAHGGSCDRGSCVCPTGYEGANCEITTRDRYLGGWRVAEKGTVTAAREYQVAIETSSIDAAHVNLKNVYNYFTVPISAYVVKDTIIIPNQQLQGKIIFGKGYIDTVGGNTANKITLLYEVIDASTQLVDDFGYYHDIDGSDGSVWSK